MKFLLHNFQGLLGQYVISFLLFSFLFLFIEDISVAQTSNINAKSGLPEFHLTGIYSSKTPFTPSKVNYNNEIVWPGSFPLDKKNSKENVAKRSLKSRTFTTDDGKIYIQYSLKNINYYDKTKKLQPISELLKTSTNGWEAVRQPNPIYINIDGSTELSVGYSNIQFNNRCKINNKEININNYTVGENGMYAYDVATDIDKKIIVTENTIETDYVINSPDGLNGNDVTISEEIVVPENYVFKKDTDVKPYPNGQSRQLDNNQIDEYVVYSPEHIKKARFMTPIYYDDNHNAIAGRYKVTKEKDKYIMQMTVPYSWLTDPARKYPVTIDPIVYGDTTFYDSLYMNSCPFPNFTSSDSILVIIPPDITITSFYVEDSYYASPSFNPSNPQAFVNDGIMRLTTSCGSVQFQCDSVVPFDSSGYCYLVPHTDLRTDLACCFAPSCVQQTFWLKHSLARVGWYGPGCNQTFVYYSPVISLFSFSASIVGHTVETTQPQWIVYPTVVCSDSCNLKLRVITNYGVPPYTITHPWFTGSDTYGIWAGCTSTGRDTIDLVIPGCPTICGTNQTLNVPPPVIVDVCGTAVAGLLPKPITIHPVPDASATPINVCTGTPINNTPTSCVTDPSLSFTWVGSDGASGSGNITDNVVNNGTTAITVTYSITPTANGCVGATYTVVDTISPPVTAAIVASGTTVCNGTPVTLTATGGTTYQWSGGSNSTLASINVNPPSTTSYTVQTSNGGCTATASTTIQVDPIPTATAASMDTICSGQNITLVANGAGSFTYVWSGGAVGNTQSITVAPTSTTSYYVAGSNPCGNFLDTITVLVNPLPTINIINNDTIIQGGASVQLNVSGGANYIWTTTTALTCTTCSNPFATPLTTTTYFVIGTDTNSCASTDNITITVQQGNDELYIPNTITPNGDHQNDEFFAYGINIQTINMKIFDRWGELIYETDDKTKGWDGRLNGQYVPLGVYVYVIQCDWNDGNSTKRRGMVAVVY